MQERSDSHGLNGAAHPPPPPHNLEAEQALLGAILIDNAAHTHVADFLHPGDFFDPLHAAIFDAASKIIEAGQCADWITLKAFFEGVEGIDANTTAVGYLGKLVANSTTLVNASSYGRVIKDVATQRRLLLIAEDIEKAARQPTAEFSPSQQIAEHLQRLTVLDGGSPRFQAVSVATFAGLPVPPREWHAKGLIPAKNTTLLGGDGGTGKSLVATQLSVATALGRQCLGVDVKRGPVIYLGAEDDMDEMHRRFADIAREQDVGLDRLEDIHLCCLAGKNAVLATANDRGVIQPTDLWAEFRRCVISIKPALVVYDTLADLFGGNENVRTQAQQFVSQLRGLALETSSTALLLAHPSLSGMASGSGTSGSTAWSNSVRSRLYLDRVKDNGVEVDPDVRILRTMKANYGPAGGEIKLRWHEGVFVSSDNVEAAATTTAKELVAEDVFLELLRIFTATGRYVAATTGANYAPAKFADHDRGKAIGKKELERAMSRLLCQRRSESAVSGNHPSLWWFCNQARWLWLKSLRRRSQKARLSWERFIRIVDRFFPPIKVLHPLPAHRFDAKTRGRSPVR